MMRASHLRLLTFVTLALPLAGAEISVKPGTSSLAAAVASAADGDTLLLGAGVYHERVRLEKPLTLRADKGAVLDGSSPLAVEWSAVAELPGVFSASCEKRAEGLLLDGKFIAEIRFDRAQAKGDWHWRTLLARGTPLSQFSQVRALWLYHPKEQRLYLRLPGGAAPENARLSAVMSDRPLLEIAAPQVVVEGLTFAAGVNAASFAEGAKECTLRRCVVRSYEGTGVLLTGGASGCTVEECEITRGAFEEWQPTEKNRRENYEIWRIHKDVGKYDRVGIELIRAGNGNRILRNRLDRVFDGICVGDYRAESLDKPLPDPGHGRGSEIAENIIENTRDSGIELGVGCVEVNVHHNILRRTHGGLRFKVPRIGPVFIHHNRLIDGTPFNIWFSMDAAPAEGYIYHNTIVGGSSAAVVYSSFNARRDFATPKWHVLNNLVLTEKGFFDEHTDKAPAPDFTASHNVCSGEGRPWPADSGRDNGSRYKQAIEHDENGRPAAGSPAIDAGLDLSTYLQGRPLPGCEPGYFKGKAPEAGADEVR